MVSLAWPVVWLCGAPGTGKSTLAWQLVLDLQREGIRVGHVDIDQLGMLFPSPTGDEDRFALKAANLAAVLPNYFHAGAQVVIVSGVVDPDQGSRLAGVHDGFELTFWDVIAGASTLAWPPHRPCRRACRDRRGPSWPRRR